LCHAKAKTGTERDIVAAVPVSDLPSIQPHTRPSNPASHRERFSHSLDPDQGSTVPPTTGYDYSNTNYILAGLIIEKASGISYREALQTLILKPLHLRDTYYSDGP